MGSSQQKHCGHRMRHLDLWRVLGFALLFLALVGYCGLPSNPPPTLFATVDVDGSEGPSLSSLEPAPKHFVAPTQVEEYRGRETIADADAPDVDPEPSLPLVVHGVPSHQLTVVETGAATLRVPVSRAGDKLARAPPPSLQS